MRGLGAGGDAGTSCRAEAQPRKVSQSKCCIMFEFSKRMLSNYWWLEAKGWSCCRGSPDLGQVVSLLWAWEIRRSCQRMARKELVVKMGDHCQEHPKAQRNLQPFLTTKHCGVALSISYSCYLSLNPFSQESFFCLCTFFIFFVSKANKSNKYCALNQNSVVVF